MKKKVFAVCLTLAMAVSAFAGCSKNEEPAPAPQEDAQTEGETKEDTETNGIGYEKLVMGMDDTFAPLGFRDENNELVGFDIDLANAVSEQIGVPIEFQPIDWSMKETELTNKNIDIIWNGYSITPEREEKVLFTKPYLQNRQIVVVMADSDIQTLEDLAGKTVAAQAESSAVDALESTEERSAITASFGNLVTFETNDQCLQDLEAGRSDAVVADEVLVRYYISLKGEEKYRILDEDFGDEEYGIGVRKEDTALCDAINSALDEIKTNGKGEEISVKWFGENILY